MNASIFIRTCAKDIEWIPWCLTAIDRFCHGFSDVTLVIPEDEKDAAKDYTRNTPPVRRVATVNRYPNDHDGQQFDKMEAYKHVPGDLIVYIDSDVLVRRPMTPQALLNGDSRITFLRTPYNVNSVGQARGWKIPTERVLGETVHFEYMRRFPLVFWRSTLMGFNDWFAQTRGSLRDYVFAQKGKFSEFNVLGAWAAKYDASRYQFVNTETEPISAGWSRQFWSWGGITPEVKAEMEAILQ